MEYNTEMARLEQFVDTLLDKYNQLKTEYHALQDLVQQRENECAQLKNQVLELSAERQEVGLKVTGLLYRIEQWEQEQHTQERVGNSQKAPELSAEELSS
nr:cell division protein ZapB [uncultured Desulfobulbus sp.]